MNRTSRKKIFCTALLICNLLFIWGNSLLPASVSGTLSQWLRDLLGSAMGQMTGQSDGILRKIAHFTEFGCLGLLLCWRYALKKERKLPWLQPAAWGCLAACVDEMLQHFSAGRAPRFTDVILDTAGVLAGIGIFCLGYHKKKNN